MPSFALDTNVLVRLFVDDDSSQHKLAVRYAQAHFTLDAPGFVPMVAVCEAVWVLRAGFKFTKPEIIDYLYVMFRTERLDFERLDILEEALEAYIKGRADYADYVIKYSSFSGGAEKIVTFDKTAAKENGFLLVK